VLISEARGYVAQRPVSQRLQARLTDIEQKVLERLALGFVPKQIAHELGLSPKTVLRHRVVLGRKLGVKSNVSIVKAATALKLLPSRRPSDLDTETPSESPLLTRRQRQVLVGLVEGLSIKELAYQLGLSRQTVNRYRSELAQLLRARGDVAIYYAAQDRRLV